MASASADVREKMLQHAANCSDCREALKIANWMRAFAMSAVPPRTLPAPGFLWWKSQLIERQAATARAIQPMVLVQAIAVTLAAVIFLWWLIKNPSQVGGQLEKLEPAWSGLLVSLKLVAVPLLIGFVCATLACALLFFTFRAVSFDEQLGKSNRRERV